MESVQAHGEEGPRIVDQALWGKLREFEGVPADFDADEVEHAIRALKKPFLKDTAGVTPTALMAIHASQPKFVTEVVNNIAPTLRRATDINLTARMFAKAAETTGCSETRAVSELDTITQIFDKAAAVRLQQFVNRVCPPRENSTFSTEHGVQILDLRHTMALVLERGNDDNGQAALCQQDVAGHYDAFPCGTCIRGSATEGAMRGWRRRSFACMRRMRPWCKLAANRSKHNSAREA